eukprot:4860396-Amphidinium_carterae.1
MIVAIPIQNLLRARRRRGVLLPHAAMAGDRPKGVIYKYTHLPALLYQYCVPIPPQPYVTYCASTVSHYEVHASSIESVLRYLCMLTERIVSVPVESCPPSVVHAGSGLPIIALTQDLRKRGTSNMNDIEHIHNYY